MEKFGRFVVGCICVCGSLWFLAAVMSQLWLWFFVPALGVDPVGWKFFVMFNLIVKSYSVTLESGGGDGSREMFKPMIESAKIRCVIALALLFFGWVVNFFEVESNVF